MEQEKRDKVRIVFFSGTGGTKKIADSFESELKKRNRIVSVLNLGTGSAARPASEIDQSEFDLTILLFPIYAFDAPQLIFNWIANLRNNELGKKFAVISVSGGGEVWPNTGCRVNVCARLEEKGVRVVYDEMMCMPANMLIEVNDHLAMHMINIIPEKVNKILEAILADEIHRSNFRKSKLRQWITRQESKHANTFPQMLIISEDCSGCGWCAKNCPMSNIAIDTETLKPVFSDQCTVCMRCVYGCPLNGIRSKSTLVFKNGFDLDAIEKRMVGVALEPIQKCCKGLMFIGVKDYLSPKSRKATGK